jgi:hypothetical protein
MCDWIFRSKVLQTAHQMLRKVAFCVDKSQSAMTDIVANTTSSVVVLSCELLNCV